MKNDNITNEHDDDEILKRKFTAYVEKAMQNTRIKYIEKQAKNQAMFLLGDMDTIPYEKQVDNEDLLEAVYGDEIDIFNNLKLFSALSKLNEKDMTIIKLHVIYGYTYKQIAAILGMTLFSVSSRYNRAIKTIRKNMEN